MSRPTFSRRSFLLGAGAAAVGGPAFLAACGGGGSGSGSGSVSWANWQLYIEVLKIDRGMIAAYVLPFAGILSSVLLVFLSIELRSWRNTKFLMAGLAIVGTP